MKETKQLIQEIVKAQRSIISIDANDIKVTFRGDGAIHGLTVSVNPAMDDRIKILIDKVKKEAEQYMPFNTALLFLFLPEDQPLLMEELQPLTEWMESVPGNFLIKWGMAIQSAQEIRAIVILQQTNRI